MRVPVVNFFKVEDQNTCTRSIFSKLTVLELNCCSEMNDWIIFQRPGFDSHSKPNLFDFLFDRLSLLSLSQGHRPFKVALFLLQMPTLPPNGAINCFNIQSWHQPSRLVPWCTCTLTPGKWHFHCSSHSSINLSIEAFSLSACGTRANAPCHTSGVPRWYVPTSCKSCK